MTKPRTPKPAPATETLREAGATAAPAYGPYLVLALESARLDAGSVRYSLAGIDEVRIGRGSERRAQRDGRRLAIAVPDGSLSTDHARIACTPTGWIVEDARSKNGTCVGGARITRRELADGDVVEVAQTFFVFREGSGDVDAGDRELARDGGSELDTLDPALADAFATLPRIAAAGVPVLVLGETGTGKELVVRDVHRMTGRRGACIAVNCGAIPPTLVESELFGYRRGAFSGALDDRTGLVRAADGGTLFLDEIAELSASSQAALLRVLQEREVTPVGATRPIPVDVQIAAATCQDIGALVELGRFRRDLHARLAGYTLRLPPLRHRRDDLGLLIGRLAARHAARTPKLERAAARALFLHGWPANIRELEHALHAALAIADGDVTLAHLTLAAQPPLPAEAGAPLPELTPEQQREQLAALFSSYRGNVSHVAKALRTSRSQVRRIAVRLGLRPETFRPS